MSSDRNDVFLRMCRLCSSQTDKDLNLYPLYPKHGNNSSSNFVNIIERFTSIKISPTDDLPQQICYDCMKTIKSMLQFENKCKQIDVQLQKMKEKQKDKSDTQPVIKIEILDDSDTNDDASDFRMELKPELDGNPRSNFLMYNVKSDVNRFKPETIQEAVEAIKATSTSSSSYRVQYKVACHICGKLYDDKYLKYHLNKHNGLKPFNCDEAHCTSSFSAPNVLRQHKNLCHSKNESFSCEVCKKDFTSETYFKKHIKRKHTEPKLPCMICKKLFINAYVLKTHMLVHSQDRKFPCDVCKKSFLNNYTLRIHQRIHTGEKPHLCNCGAAFAYKVLLKTHMKKGCADKFSANNLHGN